MSSLKDLEAAFEAELNLASCRLEALGLIKEAVERVTALGFRVDMNPSCSPRGELVDLTFWLDAFDSKIEAGFMADETAPDFTLVEDFIGGLPFGVDVTPVELMGPPIVFTSGPQEDAAKDAQPDSDPVPDPVPAKGVPQAVVPSAPVAPVAEVAASAPAVAAPLQETKIGNAVDAPPLGALSDADKRLDARLEAIGNKGKFTDPADDLYLVENLASGKKLAHVAAELDIDPAVCKHRFDLLVPTKTAQEQEQVARALRRRAIAARARAA